MTILDTRKRLLILAAEIGSELRQSEPLSYPRALDLLTEVEDTLSLIVASLPEHSTLSGSNIDAYLPTRHPGTYYPGKTLPNTLAGRTADIHPALRPTAQTEDFTE